MAPPPDGPERIGTELVGTSVSSRFVDTSPEATVSTAYVSEVAARSVTAPRAVPVPGRVTHTC